MVPIGERIAEARGRRGLTQAVLARKIGTSAQALGQVEQGWRAATVPWLAKLARALGADLGHVLTGVDPALARVVARVVADRAKGKTGSKTLKLPRKTG